MVGFKRTSCFIRRVFLAVILTSVAIGGILSIYSLHPDEFQPLSSDVQVYYCYGYYFRYGLNNQTPSHILSLCGSNPQGPHIKPYHLLPNEYPVLSLIPFSLGVFTSLPDYQLSFEVLMLVVLGLTCLVLKDDKASLAAFLTYILLGNIVLALNRFDLIPALLTLLTLIAALKKRFMPAYLLLGLSVMFKLYALPLVVPLFIAEQQTYRFRKLHQRLKGIAVFLVTLLVIQGAAVWIDPGNSLNPLTYFSGRPIHIQSLSGSFLWLFSDFGVPICTFSSFGSNNITSRPCTLTSGLSPLDQTFIISSLLAFIGLFIKILLDQVNKRIDLVQAMIAVLLATLITNKIFSPQYLLWVTPLLAFKYGLNSRLIAWWGGICLLTSLAYPLFYRLGYHSPSGTDLLFSLLTVRNCLLVLFAARLIFAKNSP